ncbi:MAG: hypothetical protein DRJ66_03810 [Thermoprotei archaeon]|nr:MAG: hypothetical protein DRJ66_03810 [Thermoprotei archaeon]
MSLKEFALMLTFAFLTLLFLRITWLSPLAFSFILGALLNKGVIHGLSIGIKFGIVTSSLLIMIILLFKLFSLSLLLALLPYTIFLSFSIIISLIPIIFLIIILSVIGSTMSALIFK